MYELVINLHMHTTYSDGYATHTEIAKSAMRVGIDAVIVTDHNVFVDGVEGYYQDGHQRVLLLIGEEIHDQARQPQKNHLLVFGAGKELAPLAWDTQRLLDNIRQTEGLAFIAHPIDPAAPAVGEADISWEDWNVQGYAGIELWNGMSEFKSLLKSKFHALYYAFNPHRIAHIPFPEALSKWDELLSRGKRVVAIGGSDAHALPGKLGPIRRTLFPYEYHFQAINTHLLCENPLTGDVTTDRRSILDALAQGRAFIGYDLPAATRGFRFTAQGVDQSAQMGEEILLQDGITLQIRLPRPTEVRLIRDGKLIKRWERSETCSYIAREPGVYRVEAYIHYYGQMRGWIFSNPIYVRQKGG